MARERNLGREGFKAATLARLGGRCCVPGCAEPAVDAHHILDRDLWTDGGYYLSNGAPLCGAHHMQAETTELSVEDLRRWCGIDRFTLPEQFSGDDKIDKWGNYVLPNGMRMRGEMFHKESVRKALALGGKLDLVMHHSKHPRTPHIPWSPGASADDRVLRDMSGYEGERVIVTEKRDGECTSLYADHMHARSLDSRHHPSRDWVKGYWNVVRHDIPAEWRVVGEGLYAVHSVAYDALPSYFEGFNVWDDRNVCLSWDETLEWFALIGAAAGMPITPVPVLYDGPYDRKAIEAAWQALLGRDREEADRTGKPLQEREGYVIRKAGAFHYRDFAANVAKWVRPGHVQTDTHWMHGPVVANGLAGRA